MKQDSNTHVSQRKNRAIEIKASVCEILEWSEQEFCDFQYEQGIIFLQEYAKHNFITAFQAFLLERSRIFWNWHRNVWLLRDEWLMHSGFQVLPLAARRQLYQYRHNGERLVYINKPGRIILESIAEVVS